jgi:two-component system sensor histidine kinase/response regulator
MRVLFQNLIGNGLKFQDGSIAPEISIEAFEEENYWNFIVSDNGIGIATEFHHKIFNIFQRLNRKEDYPGTGIGLSTCRKFIRLCGGDINFESQPGRGTQFCFTIPMRRLKI